MDLFGHVNFKYSRNKLYSVEKWKYITALFTNMRTLKFKSRLHNCVFRCRQSQLRSQATNLETQKHSKRIEIHQWQTQYVTFWTRWSKQSKVLFSKKSAKMIDGSEKRNRQLAFEFHNSRVFEKRSHGNVSLKPEISLLIAYVLL